MCHIRQEEPDYCGRKKNNPDRHRRTTMFVHGLPRRFFNSTIRVRQVALESILSLDIDVSGRPLLRQWPSPNVPRIRMGLTTEEINQVLEQQREQVELAYMLEEPEITEAQWEEASPMRR